MPALPAATARPAAAANALAMPAAVERTLRREVDAGLLKAAAEKPVDAVVFFKAPTQGKGIASAMQALTGAEALDRGPERKTVVYDALNRIADTSLEQHMPTLQQLQQDGQLKGIDVVKSMNAVRLRGASLEALKQVAGPGVLGIVPDEIVAAPQLPSAFAEAIGGAALGASGKGAKAPATPAQAKEDPNVVWMDWGTAKMNAAAAWKQGITGAGITIGSLDTGVITDHSGLKANYRGTKPDGSQDHNYNLWNGVEKGSITPVDDVGHGTHTVGSALGNDRNHITGPAPDAKFIAGRGLGEKGGSLFGLMAGMEWFMAPTDLKGKNPRPDLAPDVIINSWGGPPVSNPFLWMGLRNWKRAGIIPVFAAGNNRQAKPGEVAVPGMYQEAITVGATEKNDQRAAFSMYGPSDFSNDRKPEVMAPGVKVYSTVPDGTFRDTLIVNGKEYPWSGTSMATPHVAGAVALYLQANPGASFDQVKQALQNSATHPDKPTHEDGYGRVQIDKLITPASISKQAKLTDPKRVAELMDQVSRSKVFGETPAEAPAKASAEAAA